MSSSFRFVSPDKIDHDLFECSVHRDIFDDPKRCPTCEYIMCNNEWKQAKMKCGQCRQVATTLRSMPPLLQNKYDKFEIECEICHKKLTRDSWDFHQKNDCYVPCSLCNQPVRKSDASRHECPEVEVQCPSRDEMNRLGILRLNQCQWKGKRKEHPTHECAHRDVMPFLKEIKTLQNDHLMIGAQQVRVGDKIDLRCDVDQTWKEATVVEFRNRTFVNLRFDNDDFVFVRNINGATVAPLGTHTARPVQEEEAKAPDYVMIQGLQVRVGDQVDARFYSSASWQVGRVTEIGRTGDRVHVVVGDDTDWFRLDDIYLIAPLYTHTPRPVEEEQKSPDFVLIGSQHVRVGDKIDAKLMAFGTWRVATVVGIRLPEVDVKVDDCTTIFVMSAYDRSAIAPLYSHTCRPVEEAKSPDFVTIGDQQVRVGDKIDVMWSWQVDQTWKVATVTRLDFTYSMVQYRYDDDSRDFEKDFTSSYLAPLYTHTPRPVEHTQPIQGPGC